MTKTMSVRLADELYSELERQADALGLAPAVLARAYLKESIEFRGDFSLAVAPIIGEKPRPQATTPPSGSSNRRRSKNRKGKK